MTAPLPGELQLRLDGLTSCIPGLTFQRRLSASGEISYLVISGNVLSLLGFTPDEMAVNARGCLHVMHWADRDQHLADIAISARNLTPVCEEFRAITKSGEVRWLKGAAKPRKVGNDIIWDGVWIDVTDTKRAEFRLDILTDHAADGILLIRDGGVIDSANRAAEDLFGFSPGTLAGNRFVDLLPEDQRDCHLWAEEGVPGSIVGPHPVELRALRQGNVFPLELTTTQVNMEGQRLFVAIGRDITQRKETETALREAQERLLTTTNNVPGIVFQRVMRASDGKVFYTYLSNGCRLFVGIDPAQIVADADYLHRSRSAEEHKVFWEALTRSAETLEAMEEEISVKGTDGRRRWLHGQSLPTRRPNGDVVWDGVMINVTDRKLAEQRLSFLAYYDPLTRLPNRTAFVDRFRKSREMARQNHTIMAVVSLGIDRFGIINAILGHNLGERVLIGAADMLHAALSRDDMMARGPGDRFYLMLTGFQDQKNLNESVERLHKLIQQPVSLGEEDVEISASAGIACYPKDGEDPDTLIKNAEAALERARAQGYGVMQYFTTDISSRAAKSLSMQSKLRRALDNREFIAYYQPQVDLVTGAVVGMEALARWNSPEMGMVPPSEFIPVAEEFGLIDGICDVMLQQACSHNKEWQDKGLPTIPVAVNVSGRQFQSAKRLMSSLHFALEESGLDPQYLELELTESSAMQDATQAIHVVNQLKEMGIHCAIDDFGTGYSSLSVLKRFPISKLKIDRSFVMDLLDDPNDAAIVDAMVAMAKALKMKVVAEGVENTKHLDFLRGLGCDQMQGYLFSRPLPPAEMETLLTEGRRLQFADKRIRA